MTNAKEAAWLSEHADDDEQITEEWMNATFGERVNVWAGWRCGDIYIAHCFGWHLSREHPVASVNNIATRGQLRLLLRALTDKRVPKAFEEMLLNSRIDDLERQVSDLQNKLSHWESRAEHAECYLAKSEELCAESESQLTAAQQRVAELELLLRGIQQDAKLGDDEYYVSMSLIMAIDDHIGLNAVEQVIVPNYAADNARLREAIREAINRSNGRYDEWGERAQMCFAILQAAIGEGE